MFAWHVTYQSSAGNYIIEDYTVSGLMTELQKNNCVIYWKTEPQSHPQHASICNEK